MGMPKIQAQTDTDLLLIQALQAGDSEVLQELIDRHDRLVRGAIYAVLGHCDQMDDVAQKVWLTVWRKIDSLDDVRSWKSWLYRLARNAALDAGRKRQRRKGLWEKIKEMTTADQPTQLNS